MTHLEQQIKFICSLKVGAFRSSFRHLHNYITITVGKSVTVFPPSIHSHCTVESGACAEGLRSHEGACEHLPKRAGTFGQRWSRWMESMGVDGWMIGWLDVLFFFGRKGKIGWWNMEVWNFGPSKGKQQLLVNIDGLIGGPFFDGLIDGNGTWFSGKLKPFCFYIKDIGGTNILSERLWLQEEYMVTCQRL